MSWLLFLDESGHDHRTMPYEIHGGVAIHVSKLWLFTLAVQALEQSMFGTRLHLHGTEIKGKKLLDKDRFKWASQGPLMDDETRRKHALNFFNSSQQGRAPRNDEFTAYGQASVGFVEGAFRLLQGHDAQLFATAIPRVSRPPKIPDEHLRKDLVFLLERYFYFLESKQESGLLVMDGTEKQADRKLVRRMERYFTHSVPGRQRTQWIVPVPLFVESDMAYAIQVADLCIYCLNWGWRMREMTASTRKEIEPLVAILERTIWRGDGHRDGKAFKSQGAIYVPDPYASR